MSLVLTDSAWNCAADTKELRKEGVRKADPLFFLFSSSFLLFFLLPSLPPSFFPLPFPGMEIKPRTFAMLQILGKPHHQF